MADLHCRLVISQTTSVVARLHDLDAVSSYVGPTQLGFSVGVVLAKHDNIFVIVDVEAVILPNIKHGFPGLLLC